VVLVAGAIVAAGKRGHAPGHVRIVAIVALSVGAGDPRTNRLAAYKKHFGGWPQASAEPNANAGEEGPLRRALRLRLIARSKGAHGMNANAKLSQQDEDTVKQSALTRSVGVRLTGPEKSSRWRSSVCSALAGPQAAAPPKGGPQPSAYGDNVVG
jgi:hypothetical protein